MGQEHAEAMSAPSLTLHSQLDRSVNFVERLGPGQALESRYVRRSDDELIVYLSTQTACAQRCRFCHLTTTGQVQAEDAEIEEIVEQARRVLIHYEKRTAGPPARIVNFNFMARGEPMANRSLAWADMLDELSMQGAYRDLLPRFKISTILPSGMPSLESLFGPYAPDIYYSLYSVQEDFRKRWMPGALPSAQGLDLLEAWQQHSHKIPRIHLAIIEGENDAAWQLSQLGETVTRRIRADFNIVRYNPPDDRTREGDFSLAYNILRNFGPTQVVDRVGLDVHASCGMFYNAR